jgi:hypothetical protein
MLGFALSPDGATVLAGYGDPGTGEALSLRDAVGIYAADADRLTFERRVADLDISCLRFGSDALYACAVERDPLGTDPSLGDFHLGVYRGPGVPTSKRDFTQFLALRDVRGPAPWADGRTTECQTEWTEADPSAPVAVGTCARLGACASDIELSDGALVCGTAGAAGGGSGGSGGTTDTGGTRSDAGTQAGDSETGSDSGCGCRFAGNRREAPFTWLGLALVFFAVLRKRRARPNFMCHRG